VLRKILKIEENTIAVDGNTTDYVAFGRGTTPLLIIPGLGDGFKTVKGTGLILRFVYRFLAGDFRIYVVSRKNEIKPGYTTREMAADLASVMDHLKLESAHVMGVSQGGMIAQWLAIDYPERILKLALIITISRQNETLQQVIADWIKMAEEGRYDELAVDTMKKSHTESYLKKVRPFYWLIKKISKPQSKERFIIQAESCRNHDAHRELPTIEVPTLIIGGGADRIVGDAEVQQDIAAAIPNSRLHIYPELGHGAYAEAKDFGERIHHFFKQVE
jgi:pimeloyl-ACP methyl ester carboxylesterase